MTTGEQRPDDLEAAEIVIERLVRALSAQLGVTEGMTLAAGAAEALAELNRDEAAWIFCQAGLLIHYGVRDAALEGLVSQISAIQRAESPEDAALRPGDEVRLVGDVPGRLATYDETWLRETMFVVRYVGDDGTVDIQPELSEDYTMETVPSAALKPARLTS